MTNEEQLMKLVENSNDQTVRMQEIINAINKHSKNLDSLNKLVSALDIQVTGLSKRLKTLEFKSSMKIVR